MSGNLGLWDVDDSDQIANASLAGPQQVQNAKPRRIGEGPKHRVDSVCPGKQLHIRLNEYIRGVGKVKSSMFVRLGTSDIQ
jgi:hypothetical protein